MARKSRDARQARRLMALAGVRDGLGRTEAAAIGLMDRQTLRDWVHRFNAEGPDGLIDRKSPGRRAKLTEEQRVTLKEIVAAGPDPEIDGVVRWRCADIVRLITARFDVAYHENSVGKLLHSLGFSHVSARPRHPEQDPETIEAFKKTSHRRWHKSGALNIPENLSILFLPPYSPELNPTENIWQFLRQTYLSNRVFETWEAIVDTCRNAWNRRLRKPGAPNKSQPGDG